MLNCNVSLNMVNINVMLILYIKTLLPETTLLIDVDISKFENTVSIDS